MQLMEFIDIEHTPKNILIRAVKKSSSREQNVPKIIDALSVSPEIWKSVK